MCDTHVSDEVIQLKVQGILSAVSSPSSSLLPRQPHDEFHALLSEFP